MRLLLGSEEHTSELQSPCNLVCRLLLEKKRPAHSPRRTPGPAGPPRPPSDPGPRRDCLSAGVHQRYFRASTARPLTCWFFFFLATRPPPSSPPSPEAPPFL